MEENTNIIGEVFVFTDLSDKDFADGKIRAYITNFYVIPEFRGRGIGTRLLENIFVELKQHGFLEVAIGVYESETKNVRLYKKLGFLHEIKKCKIDPICIDETGNPFSMNEFILIIKYL